MKLEDFVFRSWNYFRHGYSTYLAFFVSFFTFVSTTYYLAIGNLPFLQKLFSNFYVFMIVGIAVIAPLGVFVGWLHMKRTLAHPTDIAINIEANPYMYTVYPGKEKELWAPSWLLLLRTMRKVLEKEDILSAEEEREFENITTKIERLLKGGFVGVPRQRRLLERARAS